MTKPVGEASMQDDEQAIRRLIATWISATNAGDTEKVLALMADDVIFLTPGRPPMRGKAEFAKAQRALGGASLRATSDVQEVRVFGDWAYCWTYLIVVVTPPGGTAVKRAGNTLSLFRRQADTWVLFRDDNMLAPASGAS
jgi:uncharacterized protein (TIGR02246 family)